MESVLSLSDFDRLIPGTLTVGPKSRHLPLNRLQKARRHHPDPRFPSLAPSPF